MKIELSLSCPVCQSDSLKMIGKKYDDRYGYPGTFDLYKCLKCSHIFLDAYHDNATFKRLYTCYYPRSEMSLEGFREVPEVSGFKSWFNGEKHSAYCWVPENVRVLDIGCGFGQTLGYHQARGCEVYGVEADENIRRIADKYGFKVHVGLFDPNQYEPDFFDYVTLDQVIEHVTDPIETLKGIARILKPGGMAIVSTPNANGWGAQLFGRFWINWHAPYHLQHFSVKSMSIAAEKAGLNVKSYKTLTSSEWLLYQWMHLLTLPVMTKPSQFWSPKATRGLIYKMIQWILNQIHRTKINHFLTRLFDALGVGDNGLFIVTKPLQK